MINSAPDFPLGETLKGTADHDATILLNSSVLGRCVEFPITEEVANALDMDRRVTGQRIKAVALRNTSGSTYAAKDVVVVDTTGDFSGVVNATGKAGASARFAFVVDFLLTDTVADDDIFWGIVAGPCTIATSATDWAGGELLKTAATGVAATATAGTDHGPVIIGTVVEDTGAGATEAKCILHPDWASAF